MDTMTVKIQLIDKIAAHHPGMTAGLKRKWSEYVGGMADNGYWHKWKMLKEATIGQLEDCLTELERESKPKPVLILTEQDKIDLATPTVATFPNGRQAYSNVYEDKKIKESIDNFEFILLWGKK